MIPQNLGAGPSSQSRNGLIIWVSMAPHSSTLAWRIPGTEELGGLPSMGSHRIGHDCSNLAAAAKLVTAFLSRSKCHLIS